MTVPVMQSKGAESSPGEAAQVASVLFLGGNGHGPVRLEGVRRVLSAKNQPFEVRELPYPAARTYDELLDALEQSCLEWQAEGRPGFVYATGIGGLVALSLRARGALAETRIVLQGAVLWGLERRWFPRLMRLPGMPRLLVRAFRNDRIRARFEERHLRVTQSRDWIRRFFDGYDDAESFAQWFRWLTPALLRRLERELPARAAALDGIEAWWGETDTVVGPEELNITERALGIRIPERRFPHWSHYPMIDDPARWVAEVTRVLETAQALS